MLGEHRLDLFLGRDFATPDGRERLVDLAQFRARRLVGAGADLPVDFARERGQILLRPFGLGGGAFQNGFQRLGHRVENSIRERSS
jgi:hypothetical protein